MVKWRKEDIQPDDDMALKGGLKGAVKVVAGDTSEFSFNVMSEWYARPAMILTAFTLFCGLLFNGALKLWDVLDQPITQVVVAGNTQYLSRGDLVNSLVESTQRSRASSTILSTSIDELLQQAIEEPWVNNASIKRQWPPRITVDVQEQVPIAQWGAKGLLNHQGDIFWPQQRIDLAFLPLLNGPSTETARVMDQFHTLNQFFKGSDVLMAGLTLQARGAWTLLLDNKIEVELGREKILARLKRFLQLYKGHLYAKATEIDHVDVRYTNGVAVKWRQIVSDSAEKKAAINE
ncbi:cell division protein FtsQ/DivIB [Gammaproteobacteria bacterium AS21]